MTQWQPSASFELIKLRADTLRIIRSFFYKNNVLEVDTPTLSGATVPDPFIESFQTRYVPLTQTMSRENFYLHTSPEFPMKRLLAAGSGSIFQISKVFRQGESGKKHNPEFTLLEWYRNDWDHRQLMSEVEQLFTLLLSPYLDLAETRYITYEEAFLEALNINPHTASQQELLACTEKAGLANVLDDDENRDRFLELLFSHIVEPALGTVNKDGQTKQGICFVYHYPASQASLAKTGYHNGQLVAERFEVFINGMELGNGFHELNDEKEQRQRFAKDNQSRKLTGFKEVPMDEYFLQAVAELPDCAGVAIGIERLLMVMSESKHINDVIAFPFDRA
ncbi:MAG: elongation factor P--(R)-beta-lysine ligase [gamma proteobacterium symbiont of Bathyaustriella thionipta]|nr:elongation factor P--(R)-beta-lysine ligase [gamma proteobacterium symbiont of Bathyaustriella thionipta]MCU7951435.1 elongation factor P--(R)-beta-lysine ligase [gamma proteobacterium symbiont of Bathyaustriella thionipta]MCU7957993.1 elongation factor P--(R)-beta-lysine ligase [gamma proteobacterium symbiont of Bathyaustriella thionipta]MCU7968836.1 elongation factor P--(R)-beta-lysine ligase [gamma proteobacterium symbiont of Bathyaustriella thionipta]